MIDMQLKKLPGPALCAQSDPEQWFPTNETPEASRINPDEDSESANEAAKSAKAVCFRCPVRLPCLQEVWSTRSTTASGAVCPLRSVASCGRSRSDRHGRATR